MKKKIAPKDNQSNQGNANLGMNGTNKQYDQAQSNTAKQKVKNLSIKKTK